MAVAPCIKNGLLPQSSSPDRGELAVTREFFRSDFLENATGRARKVFQGSARVTSPSPAPKIRRGERKSLCANVIAHPGCEIIFALGLGERELATEPFSATS